LNQADLGFSSMFWGDSQTYDLLGAAVAEGWSYGSTTYSWTFTIEGMANRGFIYFVASIYYVFGRNQLLVQFINGIIGALTAICIFELGLLIYGKKVARLAMLFTAFFPQVIFWSAGMYKDPAVMLCIAANILATLQMKQRFSMTQLALYIGSAAALVFLRFYIFYVILAATLASYLIGQRRLLFGMVSQIALVACTIVLFLFTPIGEEALSRQRYLDLQQVQASRDDLARAGSGYLSDADVSTPGAAIRFLPIGITYLLLSPFPWTVSSLRQALALPDVLVWYLMIPFLFRGLFSAMKHRLSLVLPILLFTSALTLAYGVFQGNAGTAYRQRTQVMIFYFLFVADGLVGSATRKEELDISRTSSVAAVASP
jgi:4-amino-4-deoxy-L-arabinose transferase-like glycosyltransferase